MIQSLDLLSAGCEPLLFNVLGLAIKVTLLLVAAFTADAILGRCRALARSSLWHATLLALAILPAATYLLPTLSVIPRARNNAATTDGRADMSRLQASAGMPVVGNHESTLDMVAGGPSALVDGESNSTIDWQPLLLYRWPAGRLPGRLGGFGHPARGIAARDQCLNRRGRTSSRRAVEPSTRRMVRPSGGPPACAVTDFGGGFRRRSRRYRSSNRCASSRATPRESSSTPFLESCSRGMSAASPATLMLPREQGASRSIYVTRRVGFCPAFMASRRWPWRYTAT
jgi:hypothetical protein